jgi:hypothetical protein
MTVYERGRASDRDRPGAVAPERYGPLPIRRAVAGRNCGANVARGSLVILPGYDTNVIEALVAASNEKIPSPPTAPSSTSGDGHFDVGALVSERFAFDEIDDACAALAAGKISGRAILDFVKLTARAIRGKR